jgi:CheY-like chemotaxis protein
MDNQQFSTKKILIADDNPAIVEALQALLESEGYRVDTTVEPANIKMLAKRNPDLLLMDIRMPGHDGRKICRDLKDHDDTKDIPVILISANKFADMTPEEAGADCFIAKPFGIDELLKKVKKHAKN